jgi:hypothetical protein
LVDVKARETFSNLMRVYGINLHERDRKATFRSRTRLDMKRMKEKGLIRSYSVARVIVSKEVLERG